jgi:tRNA dimethylallyltransferase
VPELPVVAVVGPTAAGKSDLAVSLALAIDGECINADAMQLYRGMDVGTAKLTEAERRGVPHHLLDVLDVHETASVAEWQALAETALEQVHGRGRLPILVGGSGLYVRAVVDRLDFPGTDPALRQHLESDLAELGSGVLHARLAAVDPAAAARILPTNGRRVVRALEVVQITGRPFAGDLPDYTDRRAAVQVGLEVPREVLDIRIEARVQRMWEGGLVEEVRRLEQRGLRAGLTASRALGYRQVLAYLAGEGTEEAARAATVQATRRFARRQQSWFRRDPRVRWLPYDAEDLVGDAAAFVRTPDRGADSR